MMQVLCYGDSNTWGSDPADDERRFEWPLRWPGVLQRELGEAFHVVEEGLGGRTTVIDDPLLPHRSGLELLAPVLETHAPLDLVIVMLGTNDISYAWASAADPPTAPPPSPISCCAARWSRRRRPCSPARVPAARCPVHGGRRAGTGPEEKSRALRGEFARVAAALRCPWLEAGEVIATSALDGWHLELSQHELLGVAVAAKVRGLLG